MQESVSAKFAELGSVGSLDTEPTTSTDCTSTTEQHPDKHLNPTPTLQLNDHSIPTSLHHHYYLFIPDILIEHQLRPDTPLEIIFHWLSPPLVASTLSFNPNPSLHPYTQEPAPSSHASSHSFSTLSSHLTSLILQTPTPQSSRSAATSLTNNSKPHSC